VVVGRCGPRGADPSPERCAGTIFLTSPISSGAHRASIHRAPMAGLTRLAPSPPERRREMVHSFRATMPTAYPTRRSKSFASEPNRLCVSAWSAKSLMT
jgi:hypothetical protein